MGIETALIAGGLGLAGSIIGSEKQAEAASKSRALSAQEAQRQAEFQQQRFETGLGLLEGGPGPGFEERLQAGVTGLQSSLAPFGLVDSSVSQDLSTQLTGQLLQQDFQNRLAVASPLLGASTANPAALLGSQQAAFDPTAGLFGDIGQFGTTLAFAGLQDGGLFGNTAEQNALPREGFGASTQPLMGF